METLTFRPSERNQVTDRRRDFDTSRHQKVSTQ